MECRLIRLGNGDVECERCKTKYGNFKNTMGVLGLQRVCIKKGYRSVEIVNFTIMIIHKTLNVMNVVVFY